MGSRYIRQGECWECGRLTHDYCDHCGAYICEDHRHERKPKHGMKGFVFCKRCVNKKAIDPERKVI